MQSNKIERINEDIQRVMASLLRNIKDPRVKQGMISVTAVDTTNDLRYSKIYLSVFGLNSEKELMKGLKSASGYLRRELGMSLSLRGTPELIFELDKSIERGARINSILNDLNIPDETSETSDDEENYGNKR
jgi:ribosome-binding factor A